MDCVIMESELMALGGMIAGRVVTRLPDSFRRKYSKAWHRWTDPITSLLQRALRLLWRPAFPIVEGNKMYLHLGCGRVIHPKFVNVDLLPAGHVHFIQRIDSLPCFKDGSADLIYASHCLEHFSHWKTHQILREWCRVLKPGGVLRLSVPDFDKLLRIYAASGDNISVILGPLMGGQDYPLNFHGAVFTKHRLSSLLQEAGFSNCREWAPGSDDLTTFNDFSTFTIAVNGTLMPVSLNLEATKPLRQ
jgi:predicted SAM-dependent methyltransferase